MLSLFGSATLASAAPPQLLGKTIVITWNVSGSLKEGFGQQNGRFFDS
jgi:hypothetical protein